MTHRHLLPIPLLAAFAFPAWADRHCGPVLDSYYQARQAALDTETSCTAAMDTAAQRLAEAQTNARICGCTALVDGLESALAAFPTPDQPATKACTDQRAAVLDDALDARIKALVSDCH
jgi:hypothetical protein